MVSIKEKASQFKRPVTKVVQFGEGNFLRAFVDYMIDIANEKGVFDGGVAVLKPIEFGTLERFDKQDNLYTVILRGMENGKVVENQRIISCVTKTISVYDDYAAYLALAEDENIRFVVSNTTEAGIALDNDDKYDDVPPKSFPAKLTVFLHHRFKKFGGDKSKGLIMIPCELIEFNGQKLKECVLKLCEKWSLGSDFVAWINEACIFAATLVDRIVTGYPRDEAAAICEKLGYNDELLDTAEPFGLWVIESEKDFSAEFPLDKAGLNVVFTNNLKPYRDRKVKLLNGAHTSMVLAAYLAGKNIVLECMNDEVIGKYVAKCMNEEIAPTVALPADEVKAFAASVVERFKNPFIKHELLSISLNSVSKWKARVLPSVEEYLQKKGELPKCLTFSLAALIAFYMSDKKDGAALIGDRNGQPYKIMDDAYVLDFFAEKTAEFKSGKLDAAGLAKAVVSNVQFWGKDLSSIKGFEAAVAQNLDSILSKGMNAVLADIVK